MKHGKTYPEMLMEIKEQKFSKRDFKGDSRKFAVVEAVGAPVNLAMMIGMPKMHNELGNNEDLLPAIMTNGAGLQGSLSRLAVGQICAKLKIPFRYAERLFNDHPDLLAHHINALFSREPKKIMVRTLGNAVRAVLSNRYRIIDNFDVAGAVMPIVQSILGVSWEDCVKSCEVTDKRMYLKIVHPGMIAELPPPVGAVMGRGNTMFIEQVQAGIKITNSEVGLGSMQISPAIYTERCTNMAIFESDRMTKYHVGRQHDVGDNVSEIVSEKTRSLEDAATVSRIVDVTRAALDGTIFNKNVKKLQDARLDKIDQSPVDAVERLAENNGLNQDEADEVLKNLINGADLSKYGLHAAVTRTAGEVDSYDRASELENLGGKIIELKPADWRVISEKRKAA